MKTLVLMLLTLCAAPVLAQEPTPPTAAQDALLGPFPADAVARLSPAELKELLSERQDALVKMEQARLRANEPHSKVEILVPLGFFASLVVGLLCTLVYRSRRDMLLHRTLAAMVEKGVAIPPELLVGGGRKTRPSDLRRGFVLVLGGLSGCIVGVATSGFSTGTWTVGLIPMFIGAGYLLTWAVEHKQPRGGPGSFSRMTDSALDLPPR
jgi:hypothetical protein